MSFRRKNKVLSTSPSSRAPIQPARSESTQLPYGLRPSPLDGRATTSTGTASLDSLLAGHLGLPLGSSIIIEEHGATDFSGVLLRYYAAEGLVQGHYVHVLGYSEAWKHELPALSTRHDSASSRLPGLTEEKMKIAWRYERHVSPNAATSNANAQGADPSRAVFCHSYDLTKRLASASTKGTIFATPASSPPSLTHEARESPSMFKVFLKNLEDKLQDSPPSSIHRVVVPSLLSPTLYTPGACQPGEVLQFLHALRALLRLYCGQLTALMAFPVTLFPRSNGVTRWVELLCDGVLEMIPLSPKLGATPTSLSSDSQVEEQSQGILRVHSLPVFHEKGGGSAENNRFREDLSFHLSSSQGLVIQPYILPPLEHEDHKEQVSVSDVAKNSIEF